MFTTSSGNINYVKWAFLAAVIDSTCIATTDNTSRSIRLNSSKQPHKPDYTSPLNILAISLYLC